MIILVVGMHRSGTSMVARALHGMGMNLGEKVDIDPHPANPNGHWEHSEVWQAQENLLTDLGREWHSSPGPLPARWLQWPQAQTTLDLFSEIAQSEISLHGNWLVKDPRSSLLLPMWSALADRLQLELRILHVFRDREEVASSLHARQGMPHALACRIWNEHQLAIERDSKGLAYARFEHCDIMHTPKTQLAGMGAFCGLPEPQSRASDCAHLIEQELWHQRKNETPSQLPIVHDPVPANNTHGTPTDRGKVLIVMRTRWRLDLLPRALRSVLAQTYPHWSLQVVNDGGPVHLVESELAPYRHLFEGRLHILHLPTQRGMEAASNAGIAAQDSEFIAIHDDDDSWRPEFLEQMTHCLDTHNAMAGVSRTEIVRETWHNGRYVSTERTPFGPELDQITLEDLSSRNLFPPIAMLFRRKALHKVGCFHEGLPALGDWHFNKRLAQIEPIPVCPQVLATWHLRKEHKDAPNSPLLDHMRSFEFVNAWPKAEPLPEYFSNARQVVMWCDANSIDSVQRMQLPSEHDSPTPPGLYLLGLDLPASDKTLNFHYSSQLSLTLRQSVPMNCTRTDRTWILLNAPEPLRAFGLSETAGEVQPIPASHTLLRLADPLPSLNDFASRPRLPDVICIGAQRSGTTWLHAALQSHPSIWSWGIKEFHQFDWDGTDPDLGAFRQMQALTLLGQYAPATGAPEREQAVRMALRHAFPVSGTWENYSASIEFAPPEQLACDFTPAYATLDEHRVAEIVRAMPDVKLIFILRDPVTRSLSGALHELQRVGVNNPDETQLLAACESPFNVLRTDYLRTLDIWESALPPDQMLVIFHEDLASDPVQWINQVCDFLRIAPLPAPKLDDLGQEHLNAVDPHGLPWPLLARVKADLSRRWLPMMVTLEQRYGEPVRQWRLAAEARIRSADLASCGSGAARENSLDNNLAQWDYLDPWHGEGDQWDGQAKACGVSYEQWKHCLFEHYLTLLPRQGTVLEIGPGHGRWTEQLANLDGLIVCCDISPNCLDACRQRLAGRARLRTHVCSECDLPDDLSARVHAVWSFDCFVHMDPDQCRIYLREIARVLVPGGHAVIHHADRPGGIMGRLVRAWGRPDDRRAGWRSNVRSLSFRRWAQSAGLRVISQESRWPLDPHDPNGAQVGVPRFGDCITVLQRV